VDLHGLRRGLNQDMKIAVDQTSNGFDTTIVPMSREEAKTHLDRGDVEIEVVDIARVHSHDSEIRCFVEQAGKTLIRSGALSPWPAAKHLSCVRAVRVRSGSGAASRPCNIVARYFRPALALSQPFMWRGTCSAAYDRIHRRRQHFVNSVVMMFDSVSRVPRRRPNYVSGASCRTRDAPQCVHARRAASSAHRSTFSKIPSCPWGRGP